MSFDNFPKQELNKQQDPEFKKMMDTLERLKSEASLIPEEEKIQENSFTHIKSDIVGIEEKTEEEKTEDGFKKSKKMIFIIANDDIRADGSDYKINIKVRVDNYIRGWFETKKLAPKKIEELIKCLKEIEESGEEFEFVKIKKGNGRYEYEIGEKLKKIIYEKLEEIYTKS